jgi:RNA polymerase sigma-70 factor (ECF subfamily)
MEAVCNPVVLGTWMRAAERAAAEPLERQSESDLLRSARGGDRAAFARIVDLHKKSVYATAARLVGPADAFDVSQEAFLRAFQRLASFDASRPLRPWLLTIARNLCIDELRRRGRLEPASVVDVGGTHSESLSERDGAIEVREQTERVVQALADLPERQREALLLFHQDQLSYREIAEVIGVPIGTVMTWIHRARQALRARLEVLR